MKKYLLSSLLIFLISIVYAGSLLVDMRVGDFDCVTRIVLEFSEKVNYTSQENVNKLSVSLNSDEVDKLKATKHKSQNIHKLEVSKTGNLTTAIFEFDYPIEVASYDYKGSGDTHLIVFDIFDKRYWIDPDKGLSTLLFKGQKFPISKINTEIARFLKRYPDDDKIYFYLGMMYGYRKDKTNSSYLLSQIPETSKYYPSAQENLKAFMIGNFPEAEIKPNFWQAEQDSLAIQQRRVAATPEIEKVDSIEGEKSVAVTTTEPQAVDHKQYLVQEYWLPLLALLLLIIIIQFVFNIKKRVRLREVELKLETVTSEKNALDNKLKKGIIDNSKTKDKIIIKLFNSGWSPEDIANELNESLETIEAAIKREGRL